MFRKLALLLILGFVFGEWESKSASEDFVKEPAAVFDSELDSTQLSEEVELSGEEEMEPPPDSDDLDSDLIFEEAMLSCADDRRYVKYCVGWKAHRANYCKTHNGVKKLCKKTCGLCSSCKDDPRYVRHCAGWKVHKANYCATHNGVKALCKKTCGLCGRPSCPSASCRCPSHQMIQNYKVGQCTRCRCVNKPVPSDPCLDRRDGYYIAEGHGKTNECYRTLGEAKTKCVAAGDCKGIATQKNVCGGQYRVSHGGPTLKYYAHWKQYNLRAWTLKAHCMKKPGGCKDDPRYVRHCAGWKVHKANYCATHNGVKALCKKTCGLCAGGPSNNNNNNNSNCNWKCKIKNILNKVKTTFGNAFRSVAQLKSIMDRYDITASRVGQLIKNAVTCKRGRLLTDEQEAELDSNEKILIDLINEADHLSDEEFEELAEAAIAIEPRLGQYDLSNLRSRDMVEYEDEITIGEEDVRNVLDNLSAEEMLEAVEAFEDTGMTEEELRNSLVNDYFVDEEFVDSLSHEERVAFWRSTVNKVKNKIKSGGKKLINGGKKLINGGKKLVNKVKNKVKKAWNGVKTKSTHAFNGMKNAGNWVYQHAGRIAAAAGRFFTCAANILRNFGRHLQNALMAVARGISKGLLAIYHFVKRVGTAVYRGIQSFARKVGTALKSAAKTVANAFVKGWNRSMGRIPALQIHLARRRGLEYIDDSATTVREIDSNVYSEELAEKEVAGLIGAVQITVSINLQMERVNLGLECGIAVMDGGVGVKAVVAFGAGPSLSMGMKTAFNLNVIFFGQRDSVPGYSGVAAASVPFGKSPCSLAFNLVHKVVLWDSGPFFMGVGYSVGCGGGTDIGKVRPFDVTWSLGRTWVLGGMKISEEDSLALVEDPDYVEEDSLADRSWAFHEKQMREKQRHGLATDTELLNLDEITSKI